jgi:non-ribosomal peptide synthetase component E (peptide arylation enzyme)
MSLRPLTPELIDHYRSAAMWQDVPLYAVIDGHATAEPDKIAVADQHERLTYREFVRRSHNIAAWLLGLGLKPGAPVALQSTNRVALALMHVACDRADLLFVPLSSAWRERELGHLLGLSGAQVLFVPAADDKIDYLALINGLRADLPSLQHVGVIEGGGAEIDLSVISTVGDAEVVVSRDPNAPRYVMVASGTTELPKMSLWTDNNLWAFMKHYRESTGMTSHDVALGMAPANTGATGYVFPVLAPLLSGATSVLLEDWDPARALELLESEQATIACAVPTQILKLFLEDSVRTRDFSRLRVFTNAGAAMPPDAAREMETTFNCTGQVVYGATDGGVPFMTKVTDPREKRWSTIGRVLPYGEVRLLTPDQQDVPAGESGEIAWRSPTKTFGYLNEPERTESVWLDEGWYLSGDLGRFDDDGYLSIIGRAKDMIIRGGQNISPRELEDVIIRYEPIAEVSVVGIPDPVYGERACACVIVKSGASFSVAELTEFMLSQGMAKFKLPERVEVFDEFPASAGGKITKVELRRLVQERLAAEQAATNS